MSFSTRIPRILPTVTLVMMIAAAIFLYAWQRRPVFQNPIMLWCDFLTKCPASRRASIFKKTLTLLPDVPELKSTINEITELEELAQRAAKKEKLR